MKTIAASEDVSMGAAKKVISGLVSLEQWPSDISQLLSWESPSQRYFLKLHGNICSIIIIVYVALKKKWREWCFFIWLWHFSGIFFVSSASERNCALINSSSLYSRKLICTQMRNAKRESCAFEGSLKSPSNLLSNNHFFQILVRWRWSTRWHHWDCGIISKTTTHNRWQSNNNTMKSHHKINEQNKYILQIYLFKKQASSYSLQ